MTSAMTTRRPSSRRRPSAASRRFGYAVAVLLNLALLYLINVWPGWDVVPFLSADFVEVLALVNASVIASVAVNLVYFVDDPAWVKNVGDLVTMGVGIAAMVVMWRVFPFDFGAATFDWALVFRIVLGVGLVGAAIGMLYTFVSLLSGSRSRS